MVQHAPRIEWLLFNIAHAGPNLDPWQSNGPSAGQCWGRRKVFGVPLEKHTA
jgi:hypothetical protein